jgi:hypothetical protein
MHTSPNKTLIQRGDLPGRTSIVLIKDSIGF